MRLVIVMTLAVGAVCWAFMDREQTRQLASFGAAPTQLSQISR